MQSGCGVAVADYFAQPASSAAARIGAIRRSTPQYPKTAPSHFTDRRPVLVSPIRLRRGARPSGSAAAGA